MSTKAVLDDYRIWRGIIRQNDQNRTLPLEAAQSKDGKYGIRVFGEALIPGKTYVMRPYLIINKDGDEKTVYGAEKEFTVTEA